MEKQKLLKHKRKAVNIGNRTLTAAICIDLADLYFRENQYEDAIDEYVVVADIYKQKGQLLEYAKVNRMIGEAYTHLCYYDKALKHQQIHLNIARKENDKLEEQRALATIGHTYLTSYLDTSDEENQTALTLAYKSFKKSLIICESLRNVDKHEHKDMAARLFANLGVVQECQGNYNKGIELLEKSINICKAYDLFEQLERGYRSLGSIYSHKQNYSKAIIQYNLAMEVAGRLENKVSLLCISLQIKADLLIKLSDYHAAKSVLLKAYKLKNPDILESHNIERTLKVVAAICNAEDSLLTTPDSKHKIKRNLYEKLGDGAYFLKNYKGAIEYYQKMLEYAQKNGEIGLELSPCYFSLAETYRDNKQFDKALEFFKKEYEISKSNVRDCINALLNIADCMENLKMDLFEIESIYKQAQHECGKLQDAKLQYKVFSSYKIMLISFGRKAEADCLQTEVGTDFSQSESDSDSQDKITTNIGDDIALSDLTDISDDSDIETSKELRSTRKRTKGFVVKKNNKGETQLHTACINGNASLVKHLIEQGHTINVRDNCGWLPIHEACICGHIEIVQMLIDKGAAINDRGGTLCNGMTPLHDAATNGHLEVIQLLLDHGANSFTKNDRGETPVHILKQWRTSQQLDGPTENLYNNIAQKLSQDMTILGQADVAVNIEPNSALIVEENESPTWSPPKHFGTRRRRLSDDHNTISSNAREYKRVMESVRHTLVEDNSKQKRHSYEGLNKSAYANPNDVGDDWLIDDLPTNSSRKRKRDSETLINTLGMRKRSSGSLGQCSSSSSSKSLDDIEIINEFIESNQRQSPKKNTKKRTYQTKLLNTGFSRTQSSSKPKPTTRERVIENTFNQNINIFNADPTLSVDVRINDKLYRVPILASEIHTKTIKWLAEEAAKRYSKKEYIKPVLELETKNGAILGDDDFVNILFSSRTNQGEEVVARIVKSNLLPLFDRYLEVCLRSNTDPNEKLQALLQEVSIALDISDMNLKNEDLTLLCKIINRQTSLISINFFGNFLHLDCVELLSTALPSFNNLRILNLSLTQFTAEYLSVLSKMFLEHPTTLLENLTSLDLSYNPLGNRSLQDLAVITRYLKLEHLTLISVDFTNEMVDNTLNANLELCLDYIKSLDISYNRLGKKDIASFLSWLKPEQIEVLNIANNINLEEGLTQNLVNWFRTNYKNKLNLKNLDLSRSNVTDLEVFELLRVLLDAPHFKNLNLSYNQKLTSTSLKRLLEHECSLNSLNLSGCDNILNNSEDLICIKLKEMKLSVASNTVFKEKEELKTIWRRQYGEQAVINELPGFIELISGR